MSSVFGTLEADSGGAVETGCIVVAEETGGVVCKAVDVDERVTVEGISVVVVVADVDKRVCFEETCVVVELVGIGESVTVEEPSVVVDATFVIEEAGYVLVVPGTSVAYTVVCSVTETVL